LLKAAGRKAVGDEALCAHRHRPASLRIPGSAADLDTPQGSDKTIWTFGAHHSESLQVAANFVVNVIDYGYEARRRKTTGSALLTF